MKVLVLSNSKFETREVKGTLEDFQSIVDAYIEIPFICNDFIDNNIDVIINEEGKLIDGMNPEIVLVDDVTGNSVDIVFGNCIFVGNDNEGNNISITDEQIKFVKDALREFGILNNGQPIRLLFV